MHEIYVCKRTTGNLVEMGGPSILNNPLPFEPYRYECLGEIRLPKIDEARRKDFLEVFSRRRSVKKLGSCGLEELSTILFYAVKPYCIAQDDYGVCVYRSAAPSAGGRHPLDVLVGLPEDSGRHLYFYQPLNHILRRLVVPADLELAFYEDVEQTLPFGKSTLLWFSVQYMRTASKYNEPMSLVWRDVGAQLCCLQQAAKFVGMDSCPIGYLAQESFNNMFHTDKIMSGGGMIIGLNE